MILAYKQPTIDYSFSLLHLANINDLLKNSWPSCQIQVISCIYSEIPVGFMSEYQWWGEYQAAILTTFPTTRINVQRNKLFDNLRNYYQSNDYSRFMKQLLHFSSINVDHNEFIPILLSPANASRLVWSSSLDQLPALEYAFRSFKTQV